MRFFSKIDRYIIRNFLLTFLVAISLIIAITVVFDFSEKIDGFMGKYGKIPTLEEVIFDYYFNFIPYFVNLFSPLFVFISVIYFTSRMAYRLEIISIITTGWSYTRLLWPFILASTVVAAMSYGLTNLVIPKANEGRLEFENTYFRRGRVSTGDEHIALGNECFVYAESFNLQQNLALKFCFTQKEGLRLVYRIQAHEARYDSLRNVWTLRQYLARHIGPEGERIRQGESMDTTLDVKPADFIRNVKIVETMSNKELADFIEFQRSRGSNFLPYFLIEKFGRSANPIAAIILTLIAVPISARKVRGGIGLQLAFGVALAFAYVFLQKVTVSFALNGVISPWLGVWLPNFIYVVIAFILAKFAQR